jgi:hypothetical protein
MAAALAAGIGSAAPTSISTGPAGEFTVVALSTASSQGSAFPSAALVPANNHFVEMAIVARGSVGSLSGTASDPLDRTASGGFFSDFLDPFWRDNTPLPEDEELLLLDAAALASGIDTAWSSGYMPDQAAVPLWESDASGQEYFGTTPIDRLAVEGLALAWLGVHGLTQLKEAESRRRRKISGPTWEHDS